jgi:hypothetical protein
VKWSGSGSGKGWEEFRGSVGGMEFGHGSGSGVETEVGPHKA